MVFRSNFVPFIMIMLLTPGWTFIFVDYGDVQPGFKQISYAVIQNKYIIINNNIY